MTWIGEVAHVAWKDVRQQRWLLVAYVALVALATIRAALYLTIGNASSVFSATMPLVVLLGCIVGAVVVQGDPPTRADAFWLSRPFRASAMLAAKLLVVAIAIALPLLGEAIGLASFAVPRRDIPLRMISLAQVAKLVAAMGFKPVVPKTCGFESRPAHLHRNGK